ncbi:hypothetical protein GBAR_LOCUS21106 [Geodia barretti]|uniref:Uncharacterized protein n=1 Tax=Geodia barretti TaxID=519541 RepID=A0AA35WYN2_GEOBA|nr:hypothetical protein GBAR_LOCUS21106 [Geodia barretti]
MQSSAQYYREKLRRHSAQDHIEHPSTASPSHHHSPTLSEVASQVSEEEVSSPIPSQLSYSPSPTPSHHSSSTNRLHAHQDQPGSVTMPTEAAESTPTIIRQLRHNDNMSGGKATAVTPKKTHPTKAQTTPTSTTPANESEVISEVLDHTPSEEVTPTRTLITPTTRLSQLLMTTPLLSLTTPSLALSLSPPHLQRRSQNRHQVYMS